MDKHLKFILIIGGSLGFILIFLISFNSLAASVTLPSQTLKPSTSPTPGNTPEPNPDQVQNSFQLFSIYNNISDTTIQTSTLTPTPTSTPTESLFYLPVLSKEHLVPTNTPIPSPNPSPPESVLFCGDFGQPIWIPDDNSQGIHNDISITDGRKIVSINIYLDISHPWVGDLSVSLSNLGSNEEIRLINRPGFQQSSDGCRYDDIVAILDDGAAMAANDKCAYYPKAISGIYQPIEPLSTYKDQQIAGTWRLNVADHDPQSIGTLNHWCIEASLADPVPPPTPTPTPVNLPAYAEVDGMWGEDQSYHLDCETRAAVDWARHFGVNIGEYDFQSSLPLSDDPEAGFVGYYDGQWGQIPPNDYGVHAPPVAELLREYGLIAEAYRSLSWDDLRSEIASGNPAIVWIVGGSSKNLLNGVPHYYTAQSTGHTTIVAPGEHVVIVVGYSPDYVRILNGSQFIDVPLEQFLDSWSVLQFMAVLARQ